MNDKEREELLKTLDGNVGEVKDALEGKSEDELKALLEAEQNDKPRKGVVDALESLLATDDEADAQRTAEVVEAELVEAEEGPTDITNAQTIHRLRAELAEMKGGK